MQKYSKVNLPPQVKDVINLIVGFSKTISKRIRIYENN